MSIKSMSSRKVNRDVSVIPGILASQIYGNIRKKSTLKDRLPCRRFSLEDLIPAEAKSHVFLGFTQDGQFLISYYIYKENLTIFLWEFHQGRKSKLHAKHVVYQWTESDFGDDVEGRDYYDSTSVYIYQWPQDDNHILVLVVPDQPLPCIACLSVVHFSQSNDMPSRILAPGPISYSVVGWGERFKFFDWKKDEKDIENVLTPGILFCHKNYCTFHTGSEVVSISIEEDPISKESRLISRIFDIEHLLGKLIESGSSSDVYIRLLTYEVFVFGISCHDELEIVFFIHAKVDHCYHGTFREYSIKWNPASNTHDCQRSVIPDKENSQPIHPKPAVMLVHHVLSYLINNHSRQNIYCLDNKGLVECQISVDALNSPCDSIVVELPQERDIMDIY